MTSLSKTNRYILIVVLLLLLTPTLTLAQDLINLPSAAGFSGSRFNQYINTVYAMFISIAALLAVVKIIIAGVKYMFSDVVTQKSDAKRDIRTALLGLLVVLAAVLILTVINPNLTSFDLNLTRPDPPDRPVSVSLDGDVCGMPRITCATVNGPGGTVVSADLTIAMTAERTAFQDACAAQPNSVVTTVTGARGVTTGIRCITISPTEDTRIRAAATALGATPSAGVWSSYTELVTPYLVSGFDTDQYLFALDTVYNRAATDATCSALGGSVSASTDTERTAGLRYVCRKPAGGVGYRYRNNGDVCSFCLILLR